MLSEGNILLCAVQEVEDHGILMETGIKGTHAFLPKKNFKNDVKIGELIYCKIQKISSKILTLAAFKKSDAIEINTIDVPNIKTLLPGIIINFNVVNILKNGLEGLLMDGSISAFANEMYIQTKYLTSDTSIIGKKLKARILYTMPLTNQLYVTLNVGGKQNIVFGTLIENAKVVKQTYGGVIFRINDVDKGFLPRKTILKTFNENFDIDSVLLKFSPNTTHTLKVMDYNDIEGYYLCTNDQKKLQEIYFGTHDLYVGQLVQARIEEKLDDGLRLTIGNVRAFLRGVFYNTKSSLKMGCILNVRVVEIDHDFKSVQVTNQQNFLRDDCMILDLKKKAKVGECFSGVVLTDSTKFYTILFFNHIKGILPKLPDIERDILQIGGLKVGSVKLFEIAKVKQEKITLKLPKSSDSKNIGKILSCKVSAVLPSAGLHIFFDDTNTYGKIPLHFLSEFSILNDHIMSAVKEKSNLEVVAMGNNQYSLRDVNFFKNNFINDFNDVIPNDILRCYVKATNAENIELECLLKNFNQTIRLNRNTFDNDNRIVIGDIVYVNVIAKKETHVNSLYVTPSLCKVWKNDKEALHMLESYLQDISFLFDNIKVAGKLFGKFSIGERVIGTVKNIIGNNLIIEISEDIFAQGTVDNVQSFKIGDKIKDAAIVWIDPVQQVLFVTLKDKWKNEISEDQKINEALVNSKKHKAIIVYFNDFVTVCTIRKAEQPLVFVPTKCHYNDFDTLKNRSLGNSTSKLTIKKISNGKLIGTFAHDNKVIQKLEKLNNKLDDKKRKRIVSICTSDIDEESEIKRSKVVLDEIDNDSL